MGYIVVQEEGGSKGARLYAEDLRNFLIQPGRTPSLVVLNSCSGAQAQPGELFSSTAADLIQGGVPAVVAMQFEISDNMGIAFSDAFYTYLADNVPIERAMAHTRADLKASGFGEWISPVLFMRTADGELFSDKAAPCPAGDPARPSP
jgi:CHAT domain-containing protein